MVTIHGLTTAYNCQQSTNQSLGGGGGGVWDRFVEQMRVISTSITTQISSFKRYSDIKASVSRVNDVLFSVDATYCHRAHVQSLTNLYVMWSPVAQLLFSRTKKALLISVA